MVYTESQSKRRNAVVRFANGYWHSGASLITTAAFLFSCTSLVVKLLGGEVPTFQVVLVPGLVCFIATSIVVQLYGLNVRSSSWRVAGLTLLRGLLGATSITCFYLAIELLPLQDAVTLFFCSPVLASLFELAVTGESSGWAGAAATACTVAGVVLVSQPECVFRPSGGLLGGRLPGWLLVGHHHGMGGQDGHEGLAEGRGAGGINPLGAVLATAAAAANAAAFVVVRLLRRCQGTVVLTWWYHAVVVAVSSVPLALRYPAPAVLPSRRGAALLAAVCATQFGGQLLLNRGFQLESATRGSAINVLQVLFSFVWDVTVLGDTPGIVSVAGSSLVAAGVLCVALTGARREPGGGAGYSRSDGAHSRSARSSHDGGSCAESDGAGAAGGDAEHGRAAMRHAGAGWPEGGQGRRSARSSGHGGGGGGGQGEGAAGPQGLGELEAEGAGTEASLRQPLLVRVVGRLSLDTAT